MLCIMHICVRASWCLCVSVRTEQHCLKVSSEPAEGSIFVHTRAVDCY